MNTALWQRSLRAAASPGVPTQKDSRNPHAPPRWPRLWLKAALSVRIEPMTVADDVK